MNKVIEFLKATGNNFPDFIDREEFFTQVGKLLPLLKEEVAELEDALVAKDVVEIVDALSDIRVYMDQFNYLQDKAGIDRVGVNEAVDLNNSLKWTTNSQLAKSWSDETHFNLGEIESELGTTYCLKDINGKVRKYTGFPKVDLKEFIPDHLLLVEQYVWDTGPTDFDQLVDK